MGNVTIQEKETRCPMEGKDDFLHQMLDHSKDLTPEDKSLLLRLAAQMADTNRKIREADKK